MFKVAGVLIALLACIPAAQAGVHTVQSSQYLQLPQQGQDEGFNAVAVAIDGDSLITIVDRAAGRQALLYRRSSNGQWAYSRLLLQSTAPAGQLRASLAMKNGLATFDIDGTTTIWEKVGNGWVRANVELLYDLTGGHAISEHKILVGASGCDADGVIFEKSADGVWRVSGVLPESTQVCRNDERDVELNYDYALINDNPLHDVRVYRRSSASVLWSAAGTFALQGESANRGGVLGLQNAVAVAPGSTFYRRANGLWNHAGSVVPIDYGFGTGDAERVVYRDGVLLTVESTSINAESGIANPYAYVLNAGGRFDHVAVLEGSGHVYDLDISGRTVVAASEYDNGHKVVYIYDLPSPVVPPAAIANDFNAHDVSGFQQSAGSSFALAGNASNYLYRQSNNTGDARAVLTGSDFGFQTIYVELRPNAFNGPDGWAGVAFRYVDADNYYYLSLRASGVQLNRRLNGVTTTLSQSQSPIPPGDWQHIYIVADRQYLNAYVGDFIAVEKIDDTLPHGSVALLTHQTRADFDNLYASPTEQRTLFLKSFNGYQDFGRPFTRIGGTWIEPSQADQFLKQTSTNGLALAIAGVPVTDQSVGAGMRLDAYGSTQSGPWFGLLARYVDERNYYYLSVRGSGSLQIRKIVNGVTTVLASKSLTIAPGQLNSYSLRAVGNELHAFVNGERIATAIDSDLASGRYGIATYRTAASFSRFDAVQP